VILRVFSFPTYCVKVKTQFKLIVKERITSVDQKDPNYVCLHHICYADDSIIVWTSISGEAYNKNVTSFLKEDLLRFNIRFNIKKANLTYIISKDGPAKFNKKKKISTLMKTKFIP
jgi:hypothetical protein